MNKSVKRSDFSNKLTRFLIELAEADLGTSEASLISREGLQKVKLRLETTN